LQAGSGCSDSLGNKLDCLFSIMGVWNGRGAHWLPLLLCSSLAREWLGKPLARLKYTRGSLIALQSRLCRYLKSCLQGRRERPGRACRLQQENKHGQKCQEMEGCLFHLLTCTGLYFLFFYSDLIYSF
jgi:hypothetical protein